MSKASPAMLHLAQQLFAIESRHDKSVEQEVACLVRVCERLRLPLTKFAGPVGYSALLSRALALAKAEAPGLNPIAIQADGSVTGFHVDQWNENAGVEIVAQFLALLGLFIGESLMATLLHDAWPSSSFDRLDPSREGQS